MSLSFITAKIGIDQSDPGASCNCSIEYLVDIENHYSFHLAVELHDSSTTAVTDSVASTVVTIGSVD
jgi:hypothetical protein